MKRLGRDAAELTALADHLTAHGLVLEMLAGPLPGIYDPSGPSRILFAFFAAMAETDLIIPTGERKGQNPSLASIYRALSVYEKTRAYPDAVEQARTEYAQLGRTGAPIVRPRPAEPVDEALQARVAQLPPDSRPLPNVDQYDQLLTRRSAP